jgi:ribosomal protein L29
MKKVQALKKMTTDDLRKKLSLLRDKTRTLRFKLQGSKSGNVKEEKNLKKEIARLLTFLNQRQHENQDQ